MANDSSPLQSSHPSNAQQEDENNLRGHQQYKDLISTLPREERWPPLRLRKYQGFWFSEPLLPIYMEFQDHFKSRPDDLFLVTYPKSGTTWMKALMFAIASRAHHTLEQHPLYTQNPHMCIPCVELLSGTETITSLESLPSPRILASHIPYSLLPSSMTASDSRIVYLCRDPKDVFVSTWHFREALRPEDIETLALGEAFELFCNGVSWSGPFWDHVLGYWEESIRRPQKILFLKYEDLMGEPSRNVSKLAEFMGYPFSKEEESCGVVEEIVRLCSFEKLSGLEVNMTGGGVIGNTGLATKWSIFFREGQVGGWKNHLALEMARRLDALTDRKLHGSGLAFPTSCNNATVITVMAAVA